MQSYVSLKEEKALKKEGKNFQCLNQQYTVYPKIYSYKNCCFYVNVFQEPFLTTASYVVRFKRKFCTTKEETAKTVNPCTNGS